MSPIILYPFEQTVANLQYQLLLVLEWGICSFSPKSQKKGFPKIDYSEEHFQFTRFYELYHFH